MLVDKKLGERYCFHRKKGKAETLTKLKLPTESGDLEIKKGETEGKNVNMVCDRAIDKTGHPFECPHKSHYHGWNYRCLLNSQGHNLWLTTLQNLQLERPIQPLAIDRFSCLFFKGQQWHARTKNVVKGGLTDDKVKLKIFQDYHMCGGDNQSPVDLVTSSEWCKDVERLFLQNILSKSPCWWLIPKQHQKKNRQYHRRLY